MTGWTVQGYARCPACTLYIQVDGTPADLQKLIDEHDCTEGQQ